MNCYKNKFTYLIKSIDICKHSLTNVLVYISEKNTENCLIPIAFYWSK